MGYCNYYVTLLEPRELTHPSNGRRMASYSQQSSVESQGCSAEWSSQDPLCCLPYGVAAHVLDYVPIRQLVRACMLVRRNWYEFLHDPVFWTSRMEQAGNFTSELNLMVGDIEWPKLCLYSIYEPNWIKSFNSEGQLCLEPFWKMSSTPWDYFKTKCGERLLGESIAWNRGGGNQWATEECINNEEVLKENGGSCQNYVTSYDWCCREQVVELASVGLSNKIMDEVRPSIVVSEWFCARNDCGSEFHIHVELLDKNNKVISFFDTTEVTDQWQGEGLGWRKVQHVFSGYGQGVRFLRFADAGKDTQYWAGHYGSKMAAAKAKVIF